MEMEREVPNIDPEALQLEIRRVEEEAAALEQEAATLEMPALTEAVTDGIVVDAIAKDETAPAEARNEAAAYSLATELAPTKHGNTALRRVATLIASVSAAFALDAAVSQAHAQGSFWETARRTGEVVRQRAEQNRNFEAQINQLEAQKVRINGDYEAAMVRLGIWTGTELGAGTIENQSGTESALLDLEARRKDEEAAFAEKTNPTKSDTLRYQARLDRIKADRLRITGRHGATGVRQGGQAGVSTAEVVRLQNERNTQIESIDIQIKNLRARQAIEAGMGTIEVGREIGR